MIGVLRRWIERVTAAVEAGTYVVSWSTVQEMLADVAALQAAAARGIQLGRAGAKTAVIVPQRALAFELAKAGAVRLRRSIRVTSLSTPQKVWIVHADGRVEEGGVEPGDLMPQRDTNELWPDDLIEIATKLLGEWAYVVDWNDPAALITSRPIDRSRQRILGGRDEAIEFARQKGREVGYPVSVLRVLVPRGGHAIRDGLTREGWPVMPDGKMMTLPSAGP